ncbi:MAG TPA: hypothetical protein VHL58_05550 [Thermoanaerobaculia bacterium]|nr:hypothetical protein [Thermoanaerobaculia bacterium]
MDQQQPISPLQEPASQTNTTGQHSILGDLLKTLGVGQPHIDAVHQSASGADVNKQLDHVHAYVTEAIAHAREQAQKNPGAVLGGLSALVIAAGLLKGGMNRR